MKKISLISIFTLVIIFADAQPLFTNTNFLRALEHGTRTIDGKPGKNYWQNRADYNIQVSFDPQSQVLEGTEQIKYLNNSPDSLSQLIIRLYPDLYKKGVKRSTSVAAKDLGDGVKISYLKINGEEIANFKDRRKAYHENTNLIVKPKDVLLPHSENTLEIHWSYKVNTGSPVRTGMVDSGSYFVAYFFPRLSVYDDIDGWDTWSYNGSQEFYNDFGDFEVSLKLPSGYVVWATGDRVNPQDNFSDLILSRIQKASLSDKIIKVIDTADYEQNRVFREGATGIWKFKATHITDFAFAVSNHYLWEASAVVVDSVTGRRSVAEAVFNRAHEDYYDVANQAYQTLFYTSHYYPRYPFPFSHITVFDGTDQMEYPMMANDNPTKSRKDAVQLTTHEIFHSYFPFYMGTNETQYAWMDEGWATIGESVLSPLMGEPEDEGIFSKRRYERIAGTNMDVPLITNTKEYSGAAYSANSYGKAGISYYVLQELLGDSLFFKGLHQYMHDWNGKHPTPYDFFYSFNSATGKDLNWFWRKWFFGWEYPEMSIDVMAMKSEGVRVNVKNTGGLPLPVQLTVTVNSGEEKVYKYSPAVWKDDIKSYTVRIPVRWEAVKSIRLGSDWIPDKVPENNFWEKGKVYVPNSR
ncbi:MAG TPA: M1 family metallopeptidase [Ginsengibacter sp.]|nr:M1 family metallopeptidase [Ginsengibacter sp.]HRP16618.1 M1 family metallopeptidase [Ginsengibacter sp.]